MAHCAEAQLDTNWQLVLPEEVREALNLQPNDSVLFLIIENAVYMRPRPRSFVRAMQGLHKEVWPDPDQWLEQERSSWE